jgi:two-component sensor histidine kinase
MTLTVNPYNLPQMLTDERLSTHLFQSYVAEVFRIRLHTELDKVPCDIDTGIPCDLLSELLTNALKYAFPDGRSGGIYMRLRAEGECVTLRVHDSGIGFPQGLHFRNTESVGLQLDGMMTEQLRGALTLTCEGGTTFTLSIPYGAR